MEIFANLFNGAAKKAWAGLVVGLVTTAVATIKVKSGLDLGASQQAIITWGDSLFMSFGGLVGMMGVYFGPKNK